MPDVKTCSKCNRTLPATPEYFHRSQRGKYGLRADCKECHTALVKAIQEGNPEKHRERTRRWRENNPSRNRAYQRRWRAENPEYHREYKRRWRAENPERTREGLRRWRTNNPLGATAARQRYRARKRNAPGDHTADDIQLIGDRQGWRCWYCQADCHDEYHVDHRIPLSRGGSNDPSNLVISCPSCNLSKHDKLPHEWCGRLI